MTMEIHFFFLSTDLRISLHNLHFLFDILCTFSILIRESNIVSLFGLGRTPHEEVIMFI